MIHEALRERKKTLFQQRERERERKERKRKILFLC